MKSYFIICKQDNIFKLVFNLKTNGSMVKTVPLNCYTSWQN